MSCDSCGAPCKGGLCQQCEIESRYEHLADELANDDEEVDADA